MKHTLLFTAAVALSLFLFAGCLQDGAEKGTIVIDINTDELSQKTFSDLYKLDMVIPLEMDSAALLNANWINKLQFIGDKIYVTQNSGDKIMVFDKGGKFLSSIDRSGNGPQEYGPFFTTVMYQDDMMIIPTMSKQIKYYDLDGNFIKQSTRKEIDGKLGIAITSDGNFIVNRELLDARSNPEGKDYVVKLYSPEGELMEQWIPTPELPKMTENGSQVFLSAIHFIPEGDKIWFKPVYADSLYCYDGKSVRVVYDLRFDGISASDKENSYTLQPQYFGKKYNLTYAYSAGKQKRRTVIFSKDGKESYIFKSLSDKENGLNIKKLCENSLNLPIVALSYTDIMNEDGSVKDTPIAKLISSKTAINENMNPVLCVYKERN